MGIRHGGAACCAAMGILTAHTAILFLAWALHKRALQTLKFATGATAPVAPSHSAGSILSRLPRGKGVSRWAGGRTFGGRPPAQWESQNDRRGLSAGTAWRAATAVRRGQNHPLYVEHVQRLCHLTFQPRSVYFWFGICDLWPLGMVTRL
ncbi:hypothetical protein NDU88_004820 [Pleurodeles waltl]|uniref:Secreted protein n=1 Tax=Pleurodeles waltl TaxID=8319 RepID=A0AAV7MUI7_PLEWA|nr:hypothetical protein NDU88_004820 [Pleurodeles waltl]